jgi:hypothetical protein
VLFLAGLTVLYAWRVTIHGDLLLPLDVLFTVEPWRSEALDQPMGPLWNPLLSDAIWLFYPSLDYAHDAWQNSVPLWDPFVGNGLPGFGRGEMFSNPVYQLLRLFFSAGKALSYGAVLHLVLGGIFAYMLVREMGSGRLGALIGALVFAYNSYSIAWLSHPFMSAAMMWLPLIFLGVERALRRADWRWGLAGSLGFALQILSGNALFAFCTAVTLGLYVVFRGLAAWRDRKNWQFGIYPLVVGAIAVGGGTALAAPQFLLMVELYFQSTRTAKIGALGFIPVTRLIRLLAPAFDGIQLHGNSYTGPHNYSDSGLYFGIASLAFMAASLFSTYRRLATWMVGLAAVTLLGVYSVPPFRQIISYLYPLTLNSFPGRVFMVSMLSGAVAAGLGADWLIRNRPRRVLRWFGLASAGAAILMLALALWYWRKIIEMQGPQPVLSLRVTSLFGASVWMVLISGWMWAWAGRRMTKPIAAGFALALVVGDLLGSHADYNPNFPTAFGFPPVASLQFLETLPRHDPQPYRILPVPSSQILFGMAPELFRLPAASVYTTFLPRRYEAYIDLISHRDPFIPQVFGFFDGCCDRLLDALNVKYVYAAAGTAPSSLTNSLVLIYDGPNKIYANESALPRAWAVHRATQVGLDDTQAAAAVLRSPEFDPALEAVVEGLLPGTLDAGHSGDTVRITSYAPERVEIDVDLAGAALVVLSDLYYPGWEAKVDGHNSRIFATNIAMRGVFLDGGQHHLVFEYRPVLFQAGVALAASVVLMTIVAWAWTERARHKYPEVRD